MRAGASASGSSCGPGSPALRSGRGARSPAPRADRAAATRSAETTSGLVAYLDGEPVGWCAVEPRIGLPGARAEHPRPLGGPRRGQGRRQRLGGDLLLDAAGFRRRGISRALARAAVDFARERGARALEGYPMLTEPGQDITWGELHVGSRSIFAAAGFAEVSHPTRAGS